MAEILGVAARGMGIVLLAIQVEDNVMKLRGFWNALKEAPEEVIYLIQEIDIMRIVFSNIGGRGSNEDTTQIGSAALQKCLDLCRRDTELRDTVVRQAEHEIAKKGRLVSIRMVLKQDLIETSRDRLKTVQFMLSFPIKPILSEYVPKTTLDQRDGVGFIKQGTPEAPLRASKAMDRASSAGA